MNAPTPDARSAAPALFRPIEIRGLTIRNRVWVPPLCQYSVTGLDGVPHDWHLVHLGSMAAGGAGLVIAEATAVNPAGRISDHDTGIWNDEQAGAWSRITRFIRSQGAASGIQLAHAGRKASVWAEPLRRPGSQPLDEGGWTTVSASAQAFEGLREPVALDEPGILQVVEDFRAGARRAIDAGFDLVEVHAAHGYLVHQFLSPLSNLRDDAWGGDLAGRARLLLEIVRAVRAEVGDQVPVFVRFSATDWVEGGWDEAQTATVARWCQDAGADFFDVSTGGLVAHAHIPVGPGYQAGHAEYVGEHGDVPVSAVGRITNARHADDLVASGAADAVMFGKAMMRDPHFALRAADELGAGTSMWPVQYLRARPEVNDGEW
ncbi:2,4-dienoyl-CoA reductase-like NADH-dependent reductase (Old Yellow Enzyme family) [Agromyces terreus]|uniref:2,4-dienoyl-CoA reductase-like NADH-dependent reductase (Old Yellow Enzyme family) n=1 Tax=Agromyces terreus TaxID=424795 RepID=A0A9X2H1A1_9MICO|nr:NADH:flavin oxidoreductase/NADH oxidase [Agromyces terreus]MCP2371371.1 2,4-dienoyl-CoA reductase-like NADH-dependent reductase (Old Yellow Enzyme family) [Agromyces terreus]